MIPRPNKLLVIMSLSTMIMKLLQLKCEFKDKFIPRAVFVLIVFYCHKFFFYSYLIPNNVTFIVTLIPNSFSQNKL